jgi:hypothetical protein
MRKTLTALLVAAAFTVGYIPPVAATTPPICNQTWQVVPQQVASALSTVYGQSIGDGSGEDNIGVAAIRGTNNRVWYTRFYWAGTNLWQGSWTETNGAVSSTWPPRVTHANGLDRLEIRVIAVDGNTWSMVFNAGGPSAWYMSATGTAHYFNASYNNAFWTDEGWVFLSTYLGAPIYHCYH